MAWDIPLFRLDKIARTTAFRITCAYLLVFTGSIAVIGLIAYFGASTVWELRIRDTVEVELEDLLSDYEANGPDALRASIAQRATNRGERGFIYLLQSPDGTILAGQLPVSEIDEDWQEVVPPWGDEDEPFIAIGTILPGSRYLLVGHDAHDLHEMVEFVEEGLVWTIVFVLPLALLGGIFVSTISLRRVEAINRATMEIRSGDLTKRIPVVGTNDEFDRLAVSINAMLDGIEDLTDGLRQVSQDIAHDLRTPLTRLRQKLELVSSEKMAPEKGSEILDSSIEDVDSLLDAFGALLRIAQIESGTRKMGFREFDLSESFRQIVEDFESVAADNGKTITASIEDDVRFVGDQSLIIHMMVNLIENAICHTPAGTKISLSLWRNRLSVQAMVSDDGPGIPEAAQENVFRRFFRVDQSRHSPGSGLGLSLVSAVAKLHGIGVELLDNRPGLKVVLSFPATQKT